MPSPEATAVIAAAIEKKPAMVLDLIGNMVKARATEIVNGRSEGQITAKDADGDEVLTDEEGEDGKEAS